VHLRNFDTRNRERGVRSTRQMAKRSRFVQLYPSADRHILLLESVATCKPASFCPLTLRRRLPPFVQHSRLLIRWLTRSCRRGNRSKGAPCCTSFVHGGREAASKSLSHIQPCSEVIATRNAQKSWSDLSPAWRYVVWRHRSGRSRADSHFLATARGCRPLSYALETFRMEISDEKPLFGSRDLDIISRSRV
jgi:hypothetical protein